MKLIVAPHDSVYKVFKTIKKIPSGKQVDIFLDNHKQFAELRRAETLVKQCKKNSLLITLHTTNQHLATLFASLDITVQYRDNRPRYKKMWSWIVNSNKKQPLPLPTTSVLTSKISLIIELGVLFGIIYLFWWAISPKATITVTSATQVTPISYGFLYYPNGTPVEFPLDTFRIPWHSGSVAYRLNKTIDLSNFTTDSKPAKGQVRLYNTLPEEYSLIAWTTLVTDNEIPYTLDTRVNIPAWTPEKPGSVVVPITAKLFFAHGEPIGELGNIGTDQQLRIEKLEESKSGKAIRAEPVRPLTDGITIQSWTVISADIEKLESLLIEEISYESENIIRKDIANKPYMYLPLPEETTIKTIRFSTNAQPGETASFLQGTLEVVISYPYIYVDDLTKNITNYLQQRSSRDRVLWWISSKQALLYEPRKIGPGIYIIPTTVQTYRWYDFSLDPHGILYKYIPLLVRRSEQEAKSLLLTEPLIQDVSIKFSPPRYDTLPQTIDKIRFETSPIEAKQ